MQKIKFIIRDSYSGNRTLQEVFAEIIEADNFIKKDWARGKESDTMNAPTVKSNLCCSGKES